jgi:hypothetical protein
MKKLAIFGMTLGAVLLGATAIHAQPASNKTNPALLYYQAISLDTHGQDIRSYLLESNWAGVKLPEEFGQKIRGYTSEMALFRKAAEQKAPCDWGIDFSKGPDTLLPHYALMKRMAQIANLQVAWALQNPDEGGEDVAVKDILGIFAAGRNIGTDRLVISVLVQDALQAIAASSVAGHYYELSPATMQKLLDGMDQLPPMVSGAEAILMEKKLCGEWLLERLKEVQSNPEAMEALKREIENMGGQNATNGAQEIAKAAGGKVENVMEMAKAMMPYYDRLAEIHRMPYPKCEAEIAAFEKEVSSSTNYFAKTLLPALTRFRTKELAIDVKLAMVRAAAQYKVHGKTGFESVKDPCGNGPFKFEPFKFNGEDRGFKLTSAFSPTNSPTTLIFVEKAGPAFRVDGKAAGQAQKP